jgi:hypothetical protein
MINKTIISNLLIISFFSVFSVVIPYQAESGSLGGYISSGKKAQKAEQRRSMGGSSRSDCRQELSGKSVELLVPETKVVHTISTARPSFFVKSNITSKMPFKFVLVDSKSPKAVFKSNLSLSTKGITRIDLPKHIKLKPQKIYIWHVIVSCKQIENSENSQEILNSSFEFVPPSPNVKF